MKRNTNTTGAKYMSRAHPASCPPGMHAPPSALVEIFGPLMIVSPHFDDAVFSCGSLLSVMPGSTVVTVCTALPDDAGLLTEWDERCGFTSAHEAMQHRSIENAQALTLLGATAVNLAFLDSQYLPGPRSSMDLLADTLLATISEYQAVSVMAPLGLFHADHILVSDVLLSLGHRAGGVRWFAYADIPYCKSPERIQERLARLASRGIHGEPLRLMLERGRKALAVEAYRSQFRGLGHINGTPVLQHTEQYWRMHHDWELL